MSFSNTDTLSFSTKFLYATPFLYVIPKTMSFFCTRPLRERHSVIGRIDNIRHQITNLYGNFLEIVGEREWQFSNEVFIVIAWFSSFAFGLFLKQSEKGLDIEAKESLVLAFLGISSLTWFTRYQIAKNFPSMAFLFATRSQQ